MNLMESAISLKHELANFLCYLSLAGSVLIFLPLTQEVADSNTLFYKHFSIELSESLLGKTPIRVVHSDLI